MPAVLFRFCAVLMACACVSCQALPKLAKPAPSHALAPRHNPALSPQSGTSAPRSSGISSAAPIESGPEAFATRVAMARFARQSLDMQYFIWDGDQTGSYLLGEVLDAADRGVRVRLLLDDHFTHGMVDGVLHKLAAAARALGAELEDDLAVVSPQILQRRNRMRELMDELHSGGRDLVAAALDTHPNVEVRIFNPNVSRGGVARMLHLIADFGRLNRRMHNKIFAADNQLAIVGGRNIGDNYYGMHPEHNWRDLDLLVRGPVVQDISQSFDLYWNSEWAVPVDAFTWKSRSGRRLADLRRELDAFFEMEKDGRLRALDSDATAAAKLHGVTSRMIEAPISVIADVPAKFGGSGEALVADALAKLADESRKEILVETAYFVPEKRTFERMERRVGDGVLVCTLTNSLASTNHLSVHAGYVRHRKDLLRSGVRMHELKPSKKNVSLFGLFAGEPRAGIHTKAVVFDRQRVFVGTFNLDPRSAELNTEIGLLAGSPQLAEEIARFIQQGMDAERSWHVQMGRPGEASRSSRLYWCGEKAGNPQIVTHEPDAGLLNRLFLHFMSWLPIQGQL